MSGGIFGLERGYCLMIGGAAGSGRAAGADLRHPRARRRHRAAHAGAGVSGAARRRPSAAGCTAAASGAGHFVKMVHNGIEYGLMAAYAEGLNVLAKAGIGREDHAVDAETAPLEHPEYYQYDFDLAAVTEVWRRGIGGLQLAARPDRRGARPRSRSSTPSRVTSATPARVAGRSRGHRRGRARARAVGRAVPALQLARPGRCSPTRCCRRCAPGSAGTSSSTALDAMTTSVTADHQPPADALVLFGATGDLAKRKLFPALYHLVRRGELTVPVIGVARSDWTDDDFRGTPGESVVEHVDDVDQEVLDELCQPPRPHPGRLLRAGHVAGAGRHARRPRLEGRRVLHGDPADDVPDGGRGAGVGRPQRAGPDRRREAVRRATWPRPTSSTTRCTASSPRSASSASTTTSARRPSRTCSSSGSPTRSSSRCGTATTCAACRSRWPSRSASRVAAASTTASARSAT